ncbi:hypothetical protein CLAFUW4_08451 [Fulvia fulva]|uniref:Uncharacterized protein n=1 Tax=Passalora fulva TaxID=5499 RepID=A0A9Q8LCZ5_PASFU|nr:uncharacterized protein CLAFUR5_08555 [Fulvia fulva]KAK4629574.1 hypothetical protein CLAFUR4_08456 [Fulvia fulva]KAK4629983.1 hypothetical protein CLAFUR0_08451 [Fulvia fulva]UJO14949.1 hypothetical protein CLAFUR5_08555 [Fulvia fulva]WPV12259.1 hypothetical protein CLAFUW4_08451 [Fulvia fulva]WPV27828.1 hypothetical protein CLAFUW7_08451 [Fulvia fulva]
MKSFTFTSFAVAATLAAAQDVTVSTTCGDYTAGSDEVLYTVPYTYEEVIPIIENFGNLTYAGVPDGSVSLNGSDNTVGTARTYELAGMKAVETLLNYSNPAAPGPYFENHNFANATVGDASVYIPTDATSLTSVCDGKASMMNFTAHFCATNATFAAATLHMIHLGWAANVGTMLGGKNFTDCAALGASNTSGPASPTGTAPSGSTPSGSSGSDAAAQTTAAGTNAGSRSQAGWRSAGMGVAFALLML